jgi:hypothetical protein
MGQSLVLAHLKRCSDDAIIGVLIWHPSVLVWKSKDGKDSSFTSGTIGGCGLLDSTTVPRIIMLLRPLKWLACEKAAR